MTYEAERLLAMQNRLGEGPRWNVDEQALYWVDIMGNCFYRYYPSTGQHERFELGLQVGVLGFRASGGLIMGTDHGFASWDSSAKQLTFIADPEAGKEGARFNDGGSDRQGRFWAGTTTEKEDPTSSLYRLDPDGSVHVMQRELSISNGIGWSPDNRTMYLIDSPTKKIFAYDFDPASGSISNRRTFVYTPDDDSVPDGLTVDSEGFVWAAHWGGYKVVRYDPDGKAEREVRVNAPQVTSCAFGGPDLTDLYITTAWKGLSDEQRRAAPMAGDLFLLRTDIRGMEEPRFLG